MTYMIESTEEEKKSKIYKWNRSSVYYFQLVYVSSHTGSLTQYNHPFNLHPNLSGNWYHFSFKKFNL